MTIYRVYSPFHDPSESGTHEYGYFSNQTIALDRAVFMWKKLGYPEAPEMLPGGSLYKHDGWDSISINVEAIEIDKPIEENNVGYT